MARGFQGTVLKALGATDHVIRVVETKKLTPHLQRVKFYSATLFEGFVPAPAHFIRLWIPDPDGSTREFQRAYTIIQADSVANTFVLDFVLHDPAGPAAQWASVAEPGQELQAAVFASKPFTPPEVEPAGYLLIGDPASTPAINAIIQTIPAHLPIEVYLEWRHEHDQTFPVAEHPNLRIHWLPSSDNNAIVAALADQDWSNWHAWVGAERHTTKAVKAALRDDHSFPKGEMKSQAYWIEGKSLGATRGAPNDSSTEASPTAVSPSVEVHDRPSGKGQGQWRSQAGIEMLNPIKGRLKIAGVLQAIISLGELVPFVLLAEVGRRLLEGQGVNEQWPLVRLVLILLGVFATAASALMLWLHIIDARFGIEVRRQLLKKLSLLPLGWFNERNSGTVKQVVTADTAELHYLVTHALVDLVGAVVGPLAVVVYLFVVDARLTFLLLIPLVAYWFVFSSMVRASANKIPEATGWVRRLNAEAVAYISGLPVVRTFGGASQVGFRGSVDEYVEFLGDWQRPFVSKKAISALITNATTFLWIIVSVGGVMVINGWMRPASLLPFLLLGTSFGARLLGLAYGAGGLRGSIAAARRIGVTLTETELEVMPGNTGVGDGPATVSFDSVTFGYKPGQAVVHNINLCLEPGSVTALVGPSGSGKSTLAALLARFYDPTSGVISINQVDIRAMSPNDLYRQVSFVLQDVQLVRESVRDNIALARPDASLDEVEAAARAAGIHERILQLPRGYDSVVGEDATFSGGQAQCATIARTLLANTPVVILDEATAYSDPESEYQVQLALAKLMRNRTVLVIAHRLHTVVDAHQIVVLDGGHIVQQGTHQELSNTPGRYQDLWRRPEMAR